MREGEAKRTNEYEGRILPILMSVVLILVTLWTFTLALGVVLLFDEYGLIVVIWPLIFGIACIVGWANILFGKMMVDKEGISIKRFGFFKVFEILFAFEEIRKIKVRGRFLKIQDELSPGWMLIQNPEKFIKAVKKYTPDKLEVK